jgi:outer membrane protein TolC
MEDGEERRSMPFRPLLRALVIGLIALGPGAARADPEPATNGPAPASLGLEEALRLALANNERALKAPLRVDAAAGQLEKARTAFLPSLTGNMSGQLFGTPDRSGRIYAAGGTLTLSQPLLNLPAIPLYAQARHQLEAERWGAAQDKRLLAFDTAKAFLLALTNERVLEASKSRLERARANQQNTEARAKAQLTSVNDATRAILDTAGAARDVAKAEGDLARAYLQLGFLVARTVVGPLAAPTRTTRAAESGVFRTEDLIRLAEARRPDVRAAMERTLALRQAAKEPLYRLAPSLAASAQMKFNMIANPPDPAHEESAQLTLTWNIYDAGSRYADRRTRVAQADSQALDEKALRRSIGVDVGVALASLRAARDAYRISEEAVAAAQRNTAETEALYQQGLARAIELVDANGRRFDAEVTRATAKLSMQQAYLDLRLALGLDPIGDELEPEPPPSANNKGKTP